VGEKQNTNQPSKWNSLILSSISACFGILAYAANKVIRHKPIGSGNSAVKKYAKRPITAIDSVIAIEIIETAK
jgi:flagellar biogenesis protein FliO